MFDYSKIENVLDEYNLDSILVSDIYNMRYISGFTGGTGYLLLTRRHRYLFSDFRYIFQAQEETRINGYEIIDIGREKYSKVISEQIKKSGEIINKLAFENLSISYNDYEDIVKKLPVDKLLRIGNVLDRFRIVKNAHELECLKRAEAIGDIAYSHIVKNIKCGMTELEVAAELEYVMKKNGAERLSFDTIVASGINSSMPHAQVSDKKICEGDFVTMDFGCIYKGYCSDMTRTIVMGEASKKQEDIYNTVLEAQLAALSSIKAGVNGAAIDRIARDIIESRYPASFGHGLGHSVGLYIHESPRFSMSENEDIPKGCVITVEPGIYIKDFGGVRIEDMIVVTKDGYENLTSSPKKLQFC